MNARIKRFSSYCTIRKKGECPLHRRPKERSAAHISGRLDGVASAPELMGTFVAIACPCGYESDGLMVGCGFAGPDKGYVLIQCQVCQRFGSSGVATNERRCSHCRSRRVRVFDEEVPEESLTCPACGQPAAFIREAGLWD